MYVLYVVAVKIYSKEYEVSFYSENELAESEVYSKAWEELMKEGHDNLLRAHSSDASFAFYFC
ncbi:MAG: hypothetical protein HRU12_24490 [Phaeodactylibacter sp.]|nr:hypothetical protein [Phaeodactylibacter sp.]